MTTGVEGMDGAEPAGDGDGVAILNPLAAEIAAVLLELGGAAHRDLVLAHVAKRRGFHKPPEGLGRDLEETFAAYGQGAGDPRAETLFYLPHGPESHRWALTDWAHGLMRAKIGLELR